MPADLTEFDRKRESQPYHNPFELVIRVTGNYTYGSVANITREIQNSLHWLMYEEDPHPGIIAVTFEHIPPSND